MIDSGKRFLPGRRGASILALAFVSLLAGPALRAQAVTASFLTPASANAGDPGLTFSVVGGGFVNGSVVYWSNQALATTLVSINQLSATVTPQLLATPGQFSVFVMNPGGARSLPLTFTVNAAPITITTTTLPPAQAGVTYSQTLAVTGGTAPYVWTVDSLPAGLSFSTSGQLTGTPVSPGTATLTVRVTDAGQRSATRSLTLTIAVPPFSITTPSALPSATEGQAYSAALSATNGTAPLRWSAGAGLPSGLALDATTGQLSGTPALRGSYNFSVQVTDNTNNRADKTFTLVVQPPPLAITTISPLFAATVGSGYSQTFAATGGTPPYTWTISSQVPGLVFDSATGILSGTPSQAGSQTITVQVTDSAGGKASKDFALSVEQPQLRITNSTPLPAGMSGSVYQQRFLATGGREPYSWSLSSGSVPGLVLDAPTGIFSGTPTASGSFTLSVSVRDAAGASTSRSFALTIAPGALQLTAPTDSLRNTVGEVFSFTPAASGGAPPYTWSANGLPAGLDIDPGTGQITGNVRSIGSFPFTVRVTDSARATAVALYQLEVTAPPLPSISAPNVPETAKSADQIGVQVNLSAPYSLPLSGQLTLTFASDTGQNDPAIQFSTGGRSVAFTLPAGSTDLQLPSGLGLQTGTVAGTITLSAQIEALGASLTPTPLTVRTIRIARAAPVITAVSFNRTSSTAIEIRINGYSSSREITQGVFRFRPTGGTALTTNELTLALDDVFARWFQDSQSVQYGGQFTFTQQFTIQGDANGVVPVGVTLTNRTGSTSADIR